ncbi:MAG TPA: ATP-binding protein, partial [Gemmatimonadales bacterium]|nr:ATP-binding protein [Gemmatimonadales bacterium]
GAMIRSLRVRFFPLVWPLVVVALVLLGSLLGRWSVLEIGRVSEELRLEQRTDRLSDELADSLTAIPYHDAGAMTAFLRRAAGRDTLARGAVVATRAQGLVATVLPGLAAADVTVGPGDMMQVSHVTRRENSQSVVRLAGNARRIDGAEVDDPRLLVVLPVVTSLPSVLGAEARSSGAPLMRRITLALIIGSVIAALVTFILSGQLTGRVEKLAAAVRDLGGGRLSARVPVQGSDEIAALAASFNTMADGLEKSEAQRKRMVSDVAHELRTPLTNLIAMVESARDGLRPADAELLGALAEEAALLNRLVDDLRDLAVSDAGELVLEMAAVDVATVARAAAGGFAGNASGVTVRVESEGDCTARADERRLGQVLRNLIGNAVRHSPESGVVEVAVKGKETGNGKLVTISVQDRGQGIAPEDLPRIWERFWRADPSRTRATGGMGLGLPVAKRLVELMGGTIEVESRPGQGSVFTVSLW